MKKRKNNLTGRGFQGVLLYGGSIVTLFVILPWAIDAICAWLWDCSMFRDSDFLGYYGAAVSTITSIWVLIRTIDFTRKQIKYEQYIQNEHEKWRKLEDQFAAAVSSAHPLRVKALLDQKTDAIAEMNAIAEMSIMPHLEFDILIDTAKIERDDFFGNLTVAEAEKIGTLLEMLNALLIRTEGIANECKHLLQEVAMVFAKNNVDESPKMVLLLKEQSGKLREIEEGEYLKLLRTKREYFNEIYQGIDAEAERILKPGFFAL